MIRNLKILFAAALGLTAFGAIAANAQAIDEFHCSVEPCRGTLKPDGTGKTAHHVFIIENAAANESVSFTCEDLTGEGEVNARVFTEITFTNLAYHNCTVNGIAGVEVLMNGCDYKYHAAGGTTDQANVSVECPVGKKLEIKYNGCIITITGGFQANGIGYVTVGVVREVTGTVNALTVPAAQIAADGTKAQCMINPAQQLTGTYTTGNTLATAETIGGQMAEAWYE